MHSPQRNRPKLVVFDLFGTLVQFGVMHHPFRKALKWARDRGRRPLADDARQLMTKDFDCAQLLSSLGINPPSELLDQLNKEIREEIASLTLFEDVVPTLERLTTEGIPIAICSNLAQPYGIVIGNLMPQFNFLRCLSYEVGAIKPEPEIYQWILERSSLKPEEILFVGDTRVADFEGPMACGFNARQLVRNGLAREGESVASLVEILTEFGLSKDN